jgi:hypothetical protein
LIGAQGGDSSGNSASEKAPQERSDEEIEAVPTESVRLALQSTLFGFTTYYFMKLTHMIKVK